MDPASVRVFTHRFHSAHFGSSPIFLSLRNIQKARANENDETRDEKGKEEKGDMKIVVCILGENAELKVQNV